MSNEIIPVLAKDDLLLADSAVAFEVLKGASSVTVQRFPFTSQSPTSHVYNIQVPSTNVVMSREVMWCSDITVTVSGVPRDGEFLVNYGRGDAFAPFPLNQLTTNTSIQINNTTVSLQNRDILDPLLRNMSRGELAAYSYATPVYLDNYASYESLAPTSLISNSPLGSYYQASDFNYPPRGSFPVSITGNTIQAVGGFAAGTVKTVEITIRVCEPLIVSPFVFGSAAKTAAGIYGVSQINVQTSMDALGKRAFRFIATEGGNTATKTVTGVTYANSYLECRFLTPKPSDLLPAINVLPAANFVNYKTTGNSTLASTVTTTLTSNNVQLNAIPDKAIIFVRDTSGAQQWGDADAYCHITGIRVLFNNQSGLLSSASDVELYRMSVEAGCHQSWLEYSGKANGNRSQLYVNDGATNSVGYNLDESGGLVNTTGSVLVLDFGKHIAIAEDYYAPSSLGQFSFQIQVDIENTTGKTITPELNTLFMTSGVFSTQNGTSACYWGVLNKEEVLKVSTSEPVGRAAMGRMVGGGIFDKLKSFAAKALPFLAPMAKQALAKIEHPAAKAAHGVLGSMGYGADMSGSAMSAGAMSAAGRKKALIKHLM